MPAPVLVLGATGILRPAVVRLVEDGRTVVGVARSAPELAELAAVLGPRLIPAAADYLDTQGLLRTLTAIVASFSAAVVYAPVADDETLAVLRLLTDGPVVDLLVSEYAQPAPGADPAAFCLSELPARQAAPWRSLLLGWTSEGRWHTPEEISAAAVEVLATGQDTLLGVVRPWSTRPAS
ncbi:hypothetical protein M6D93_18305 [Jatrophihabitans telluris]|uniref:Uncharacterized protein n=1 Tax=Jatrophihabitans telluris TaxID=2038343 RepID=A0ABY4QX31_9ACTN|nr:hypothetical protein [Jatrophihabitans telluris]UQX88218.1 hypothetical protein M6D93_18305 [Jatrophihabitans telluris]